MVTLNHTFSADSSVWCNPFLGISIGANRDDNKNQVSTIVKIKEYFQHILCRQTQNNLSKFPSASALAGFLKVSVNEIRIALEELKDLGFDYKMINPKEAILVWDCLLLPS